MWLADLTQLPSLVKDLIALQREQNSLLRELILATTGRRAETSQTRVSATPVKKLTASSVTRHSREDLAAIQTRERARTEAPWREAVEPSPPHPSGPADAESPTSPPSTRPTSPRASASAPPPGLAGAP